MINDRSCKSGSQDRSKEFVSDIHMRECGSFDLKIKEMSMEVLIWVLKPGEWLIAQAVYGENRIRDRTKRNIKF